MSANKVALAILERLQQQGFSGYGDYLELESGLFFPQLPITNTDKIFAVACSSMNWINGAPGLLLHSNGTVINKFHDVGIFIGRLPDAGESISIG